MGTQWSPGGKGAHARLEMFVTNRLRDFSTHRTKTDRESTSGLSPHIHYGEISNRHIYYVVQPCAASFRRFADAMPIQRLAQLSL